MRQISEQYILSCDWGTSSFRLRLVDLQDQEIKGEVVSGEGIASTFNRWKRQETVSRLNFYREELRQHIRALSAEAPVSLENIPVIISGMASSSIGMAELPYASVPFPLDGRKTIIQKLEASAGFPHEVFLISGLQNQHDVMRGEETQILGLISHFEENSETAVLSREAAGLNEDAVFVFPGTHSKHIFLRNGEIIDFETYMTGEIFQLLTSHSILKEAVERIEGNKMRETDLQAFRQGINHPQAANLLQSLFSVRINQLFGDLDKRQNFYYLSGLLIASELKNLTKRNAAHIVLCSGSTVFDLYKLAFEELGLPGEVTVIAPRLADRAAVNGHIRLYQMHHS